jgi:drug/metabolite transporter (DMT)-like permease
MAAEQAQAGWPSPTPTLGTPAATHAALTLTVLLWSSNFIIGRAVRADVTPATLNFLRWALALMVLVPITLPTLVTHRKLLARHWKLAALLGFTGIAAFQTLGYVALTMTTAMNSVLLLSLAPLAIAALSWLAHGEQVTSRQGVGMATSLVGATVLVLHGDWATLAELRFNAGDLWMLLAVAVWAVYSVLLRRRPPELPPLALHTVSVAAGTLCMLPAYALEVAHGNGLPGSAAAWAAVAFVAVFSSAFAHALWVRSVAAIGVNRAGVYIHLLPLFGAMLAMAFLSEPVAPYHVVGAVLVLCGVVLTSRA